MAQRLPGVKASVGFASETGPRERNEDFAGAVFGWELPQPRLDVVAAIADGIGGAKGGRVAAEMAVRGFFAQRTGHWTGRSKRRSADASRPAPHHLHQSGERRILADCDRFRPANRRHLPGNDRRQHDFLARSA